jgi:hypothetical protein
MNEPTRHKPLRWRRGPRRVGEGERGWELRYGDVRIATVGVFYGKGEGFGRVRMGYWFRVDGFGIPPRSTSGYPTADEAKAACREWVARHLIKPAP